MERSALLRVFYVVVACVALAWSARPAFAQRGGHGGGGAFHGNGGSFHGGGGGHYSYAGGHAYGGYHGGGYADGRGYYGNRGDYGWRGGYGWGGRYGGWGYPRYGWGWGWGFGFGWPYWGWNWGYPFYYDYSPWYYAPSPYYDPYYCPPGYRCPLPNGDDPPSSNAPNMNPRSGSNPAKPWRPPASNPDSNPAAGNVGAASSRAPILSVDKINPSPSNYRVARSTPQQRATLSPEVQSAMRHLRDMPPFAREREIETGRYSHFSSEQRELLRSLK